MMAKLRHTIMLSVLFGILLIAGALIATILLPDPAIASWMLFPGEWLAIALVGSVHSTWFLPAGLVSGWFLWSVVVWTALTISRRARNRR